MEIITVNARRWRDNVGNTYHSVDVSYTKGTARITCMYHGYSAFTYGYGDQWKLTAMAIFKREGLLAEGERSLEGWALDRDDRRALLDVVDVARRRDLHGEGKS